MATYPSLKPTLTLTSHLGQNVALGEGRWTVDNLFFFFFSSQVFRERTSGGRLEYRGQNCHEHVRRDSDTLRRIHEVSNFCQKQL